jgi:CRISPR/Cas system-associated exonuclease Cas4 (RecB family)
MSARRAARDRDEPITISASEIGEYAYCSRAWWYKHVARVPMPQGTATGRLAAGRQAHRHHGSLVANSARLRAVGIALALCGIAALVLAVIVK